MITSLDITAAITITNESPAVRVITATATLRRRWWRRTDGQTDKHMGRQESVGWFGRQWAVNSRVCVMAGTFTEGKKKC